MTTKELLEQGFRLWSETMEPKNLYLIPERFYDKLFEKFAGKEITDIMGRKKIVCEDYKNSKSPNYIDDDTRFGLLAYGFIAED